MNLDYAHRCFKQGDASHWKVAPIAYNVTTYEDKKRLAYAIGRTDDTVDNLAYAYALFILLIRHNGDSEPIRGLRRKFPYTRWAAVFRKWKQHEFSLDEARDWLENFDGGNDALGAELENKHGRPEWERRAGTIYREAIKLDGAPERLQVVAKNYVKEYDFCFPKVKR